MSDHLKQPPLPRPESERFRRRQFVAPHRRRGLILRLARPFLAAVAIVGLPSALVAWVLYSGQFAVQEVSVASTSRVSASWVEQRLETLKGRQLFGVNLRDVESALAGHNWVLGVRLRRRPPNRLEIDILEKRPVALRALGENLVYLDRHGRVIGPYRAGDPGGRETDSANLVLMSAPENRPDLIANGLELLDSWRRKKLPYGDGLSEIAVLAPTDFRVVLAELPFPVFVSSSNHAEGLAALVRYGPQIEDRFMRMSALSSIGAVDLRFRGRIVFQPAAPRPHNPEGERNA